jgi:hypothetical protein
VEISLRPPGDRARFEFFRLASPGHEVLDFSTSMSRAQAVEFRDKLDEVIRMMADGDCSGL